MNLSLSKFKTKARAAVVAVSLAASMAAVPTTVFAQPTIQFGFGGSGFSFGFTLNPDTCVTKDQIRRILRRNDFYDIVITSFTATRATAEAFWEEDDEEYRIRMYRCPFDIRSIRQIS
jgi:hypothetical protein